MTEEDKDGVYCTYEGQTVEARRFQNGRHNYEPGTIGNKYGDGSYEIECGDGKHEASIPAHLIRTKDKDKDKDDPKVVDMDANSPQNKTYRSFFLFLQSLTLTFVLFLAFFDESWSRDEEILCRMGRGMIFQKVALRPCSTTSTTSSMETATRCSTTRSRTARWP